ncbi:toll/interleukin-1 receptor domain-containing protein [Paenibacillus polymyxa]|uniref:toll/interleukin-1 receptor domain-containing protein n=1 Tax=Paenibacillus polymyxa TaxID=1406 RepID=UPI00202498DA|nr:toll/interleukin-1 receptor domain-containing protein [Paenibacillus polymyxa]URJ43951.1 toll/interleukin-1 receptor domain-containing protein [Paenibacillus polymyxa]
MRKPKVFLSHSKSDRKLIERLANDLRRARIDVWYDEWEIPPGEPFRKKIFEDGIPNCDLFFVYLTPNSLDSFWVTRELDAAYIHEINTRGSFIGVFVDSDETRRSLPLDIQALNSPVFNDEESSYFPALTNLISRIWESTALALVKEAESKQENTILKLQNSILELQNQLLQKDITGGAGSLTDVINSLEQMEYELNGKRSTFKTILMELSNALATGINRATCLHRMEEYFGITGANRHHYPQLNSAQFLGEFIILDIVTISPATGEFSERYFLSELGREVVKLLKRE